MKEEEKGWFPRFKFWGQKEKGLLICSCSVHPYSLIQYVAFPRMASHAGGGGLKMELFFPLLLYLVSE